MKQFLRKNITAAILTILLILSVSYNIYLVSEISAGKTDIVGTFSTEKPGEAPGDPQYFVFTRDGVFYYYKQFEFLEKGTYIVGGTQVALKGGTMEADLVLCDKQLYFFDPKQNEVSAFYKISREALFVNVDKP